MDKKVLMSTTAVLVLLATMAIPVLALPPSGKKGKSNNGSLLLVMKTPSGDWPYLWPYDAYGMGNTFGVLKYNLEGPEFEYLFNGHGLQPETDYSLIYYADPWPGDGTTHSTGALIASGTTDIDGNLHLKGSVELNTDLPNSDDANIDDGAKIWLVLSSDYDATNTKMTGWNPTDYLFEYDKITYDDTEVP